MNRGRLIARLFVIVMILISGVVATQFYTDIRDAFEGPQPEDAYCDDQLPGTGWDGRATIDTDPFDGKRNVTCVQQVAVTLVVNETRLNA